MNIQKLLIVPVTLAALTVLTGCPGKINTREFNRYFTQIDSLTIVALDPVIQKNDILYISFSVPGTESAQE